MSIKRRTRAGPSRRGDARGPGDRSAPDSQVLVRTYAVTHPPNLHLPPRAFPHWDQLIYAATGLLNVGVRGAAWVVPPSRCVWIARGTEHEVRMQGRVSVRMLFFHALPTHDPRHAAGPGACHAIQATPLLRELIAHACEIGVLRRGNGVHERLAAVVLDQLQGVSRAPLALPMPTDPDAATAAELFITEPATATIDGVAARLGVTRRTLERRFGAATGWTLGRWVRRARMIEALRRVAAGTPVTRVATEVGYQSPSAFVAAFRRELGTTPARYFSTDR